ncbi:MAG: hypothetical protein NUV51_02450 [Sulfuricaulis sp.]|nr:hypothetical protein [Sulfuricaulis sp.]
MDKQALRRFDHFDQHFIAARDFFAENKLTPKTTTLGKFEQWEAERYKILVGDFFSLETSHLSEVASVYDRASLIALPPALRQRYADHLAAILPAKTEILLVTLEYPEDEMEGPPFSVTEAEVRQLFERHYRVAPLKAKNALAENPQLRERGYRLTPA